MGILEDAKAGNYKAVQQAIANGADVNQQDEVRIINGSTQVGHLFERKSFSPNRTSFLLIWWRVFGVFNIVISLEKLSRLY
jgi:hypothetical protein